VRTGRWDKRAVRTQLLLFFLSVLLFSFLLSTTLVAWFAWGLSEFVVSECEYALKAQTMAKGDLAIREATQLLTSELDLGVHLLINTPGWALADVQLRGDNAYSFRPLASYPDNDPEELKQPVTFENDDPSLFGRRFKRHGISRGASSVYIEGFDVLGYEVGKIMHANVRPVNRTSRFDLFAIGPWGRAPQWVQAYVALDENGLYRQYPGWSSRFLDAELIEEPLGTPRSYFPRERFWYQAAMAEPRDSCHKDQLGEGCLGRLRFEGPYLEYDDWELGKGWMISAVRALGTGPGGKESLGVLGADIYVPTLRHVVEKVRSRETGEAHLFLTKTGQLAASKRWSSADFEVS
jgi:hypothetical protein